MQSLLRIILLSVCVTACAFGDQIILKNGDRLSGSIVKSDNKTLTLKSEFAGTVEIQWDAITQVTADSPIFVNLSDGQTVAGTVTTTDARLSIITKDTGVVVADKSKVTGIRNAAEQKAHEAQMERYRNPRLVDLWAGFVDLGFAQSTGNSITSTITSSANAARITKRDKINTYFTSIYSQNNLAGKASLTANSMRGGIGYSLNVSPKMFAYGSTDLEFDEFQKLDLRFVPAGGFGYHARKTEHTVLDLMGGGSLNREFFSTGLSRTSGEATFGDELSHKIFGGTTTVRQKLAIYPNLTRRGEYRINFDLSQATVLRKWLAWQVSFSNRWISNPLPGRKTNDLIITTGFRITFAP